MVKKNQSMSSKMSWRRWIGLRRLEEKNKDNMISKYNQQSQGYQKELNLKFNQDTDKIKMFLFWETMGKTNKNQRNLSKNW